MNRPRFEVCLQGIDDVYAAHAGGADRVELCSALVEGGLTPSHAAIAASLEVGIDVMVMIRPRGGDFDYSARELDLMEKDIAVCRELGVTGVVFGMLQPDGQVARTQVQRMVEAAGPLQTTFHRAFDVCRDPWEALEELIGLGVDRILTSGQRGTVPEGISLIRGLIERAGDRISIMPGCGITADNVAQVIALTGAEEFHATAFDRVGSHMAHRNEEVYMGIPGLEEYEREAVTPAAVRRFLRQFPR
ncbi:copper homeostasis protein [Lewinella marina]|uniref:PF03932 family protein CutC n=1 Tax=Neolewinella marina TaxID=438751 RepID=A0A2G0CFM4_9BACT|nr:copper homeostasis protein CutC [Neolewinella marina]NJB85551.1 copper homeostasis protein [Neolewinella marina]PHK98762.1 copper homeostasis protein CutC [Neolewinella marina]